MYGGHQCIFKKCNSIMFLANGIKSGTESILYFLTKFANRGMVLGDIKKTYSLDYLSFFTCGVYFQGLTEMLTRGRESMGKVLLGLESCRVPRVAKHKSDDYFQSKGILRRPRLLSKS